MNKGADHTMHRIKLSGYHVCQICNDAYTMYKVTGGYKLGKAANKNCCAHCYHVLKIREKRLTAGKVMS